MIAEVGLRCAAGVTAIWWRFAVSFADRDGLKGRACQQSSWSSAA
jgi:hypothetical protein